MIREIFNHGSAMRKEREREEWGGMNYEWRTKYNNSLAFRGSHTFFPNKASSPLSEGRETTSRGHVRNQDAVAASDEPASEVIFEDGTSSNGLSDGDESGEEGRGS